MPNAFEQSQGGIFVGKRGYKGIHLETERMLRCIFPHSKMTSSNTTIQALDSPYTEMEVGVAQIPSVLNQ